MQTHGRRARTLLEVTLGLALMTGCQAGGTDIGMPTPTDPTLPLAPPTLDVIPARTPLSSVSIRGKASGARVVVQGGPADSSVTPILPGGGFCLDMPLDSSGTTNFKVIALDLDGRISDPVEVNVTVDSSATMPTDSCASSTAQCAATETCGNGIDDNCNGWTDEGDNACSGCVDDYFSPNDTPFNVPLLKVGSYRNLEICPRHTDWYAMFANAGETIDLTATFGSSINLDLKLYRAMDAAAGKDTPVATSTQTGTTSEHITHAVTTTQTFYLKVYTAAGTGMGSYTLAINQE